MIATETVFFDKFLRRTVIQAVLRCETGLRIGAGKSFDATTTDLPVLRDAAGRPIVPGASIKGVVRSQLEAMLRPLDGAEGRRYACDPFDRERRCLDLPKTEGTASARAKAWRETVEQRACVACRIFGAPGLASHVVFTDALPVPGSTPVVEVRDGVGIDRDLGRVSGARKYDFEVLASGSELGLRLSMNDLADAFEGAVLTGLELLDKGFARLGGAKSRGLGVVSLHDQRVDVMEGTAALRSVPWDEYSAQRGNAFAEWLEERRRG